MKKFFVVSIILFVLGFPCVAQEDFNPFATRSDLTRPLCEADKLKRVGWEYYFPNGESMWFGEYTTYLSKRCRAAYEVYCKGLATEWTGWGFLIAGGIVDLSAWGVFLGDDDGNINLNKVLIWYVGVAGTFEVLSIPLVFAGRKKQREGSLKVYNSYCNTSSKKRKNPYTSWNVQVSKNGVGLAFNW